ncbi:MAG: hypothetical protein EA344_05860 [Alkalicoccus sp.]|nr:MAG: hypothetical protein EA344_05860 [Alkalicoccus sp.]
MRIINYYFQFFIKIWNLLFFYGAIMFMHIYVYKGFLLLLFLNYREITSLFSPLYQQQLPTKFYAIKAIFVVDYGKKFRCRPSVEDNRKFSPRQVKKPRVLLT